MILEVYSKKDKNSSTSFTLAPSFYFIAPLAMKLNMDVWGHGYTPSYYNFCVELLRELCELYVLHELLLITLIMFNNLEQLL